MRKTISKSLIAAFVLTSAPTLIACDGEKKEETAKKEEAKPADAEKKEEAKPVDPAVQKEAEAALADAADGLDPKVAKAVNIARVKVIECVEASREGCC